MSERIEHLCSDHKIDPETETLMIGTFNPRYPGNKADFFYGRGKNYLWRLLPNSFGEAIDLKAAPLPIKKEFMKRHKVDFIDLISSASIKPGWKLNFQDRDLNDNCELEWRVIETETATIPLKRALFTRKAFNDVPKMRDRVNALTSYFSGRGVKVGFLPTPSRFYNDDKQREWTDNLQRM